MLTNGIQQTEEFNNFKSNYVMAVVTPAKGVSWTVNYYAGQEQADQGQPDGPNGWFKVFDTYVAYTANEKMSFGADVNHTTNQVHSGDASGSLTGFGGYARYQVSAPAALAFRYEYLNDDGGLFGGLKQNLQEVTFTLEHKLADGFLVRGEFRRDWSNQPVLSVARWRTEDGSEHDPRRPGVVDGRQTRSLVMLLLGMVLLGLVSFRRHDRLRAALRARLRYRHDDLPVDL